MSEFYGKHSECKEHVPYVYSQWCYCDSLDGEVLRTGDVLDVTWKDGTSSRETIDVEESTHTVNDMGHPYDCGVTRAFISTLFHGGVAKARLLDLAAKAVMVARRPIPPPAPKAEDSPSRNPIYPSPRFRGGK
jgi:hypothetical protein